MTSQQQRRQLKRKAAVWREARDIIAAALVEWGTTPAAADARAEAIIARLESHRLSILLEMQDDGPA